MEGKKYTAYILIESEEDMSGPVKVSIDYDPRIVDNENEIPPAYEIARRIYVAAKGVVEEVFEEQGIDSVVTTNVNLDEEYEELEEEQPQQRTTKH